MVMNNKRTYTLDKERLQQYNELKPAAKKVLGFTARAAVKMMKMIVKAAWLLPGMVRKLGREKRN
jgi:hypothetical protein